MKNSGLTPIPAPPPSLERGTWKVNMEESEIEIGINKEDGGKSAKNRIKERMGTE